MLWSRFEVSDIKIIEVNQAENGVVFELGTDAGAVLIQTPSLPLQWDVMIKTFDNGQACSLPLSLKGSDARAFSKWLKAFDERLSALVEGSKAEWGGAAGVAAPGTVAGAEQCKVRPSIRTAPQGGGRNHTDPRVQTRSQADRCVSGAGQGCPLYRYREG